MRFEDAERARAAPVPAGDLRDVRLRAGDAADVGADVIGSGERAADGRDDRRPTWVPTS